MSKNTKDAWEEAFSKFRDALELVREDEIWRVADGGGERWDRCVRIYDDFEKVGEEL